MATLIGEAVKAATQVVLGTGLYASGGISGSSASSALLYDPVISRDVIDSLTAAELYRTQPHLRTVVGFVARNAAQLGRHIYAKADNDSRERITSGPAPDLLRRPNDYMTGFELFTMLFSELALYDMAIWVPVLRDGVWQIDPLPMEWVVSAVGGSAFAAAGYRIQKPGESTLSYVAAKDAVVFKGYNPGNMKRGSSSVDSLRGTLSEQVDALLFRRQMWKRGGRVGMFMTRPKDAPAWSPEAKQKFIQNWKNTWSGSGANAGSTPLLEDGMELKRVGFTAKEEQWLEAATLSLTTVAGAYHVPPAMVGVPGYNSFASVREFRKMLYTETLGPLIAQVEDTWNTRLMPIIAAPPEQYLELNIQEKLQGDFEEQAAQLFQAVGGPYMTAAEARKTMNLPYLEGTDTLLAPLNMGAAGNNGPAAGEPLGVQDAPPDEDTPKSFGEPHQGRVLDGATPGMKAVRNRVSETQQTAMANDLRSFFAKQRKAVIPAAAAATVAKADPSWWDQKAWTRELEAVLLPHITIQSASVARRAASDKGLDPADYSIDRTANFLKAVSHSRAAMINGTTRDQLVDVFAQRDDIDIEAAMHNTFDIAEEVRAPEVAGTLGTFVAGWATTEMARQLMADRNPTKTWVSSGLPNSRHASMNGETVGLDEHFSNGANWPGDPALGAKGVSNCGCGVDIN